MQIRFALLTASAVIAAPAWGTVYMTVPQGAGLSSSRTHR